MEALLFPKQYLVIVDNPSEEQLLLNLCQGEKASPQTIDEAEAEEEQETESASSRPKQFRCSECANITDIPHILTDRFGRERSFCLNCAKVEVEAKRVAGSNPPLCGKDPDELLKVIRNSDRMLTRKDIMALTKLPKWSIEDALSDLSASGKILVEGAFKDDMTLFGVRS